MSNQGTTTTTARRAVDALPKRNRFCDAVLVQDACNLRAIARLLVTAADEAADEGGTEASYKDPAVVLIVNKIESLVHSEQRFDEAFKACSAKGGGR